MNPKEIVYINGGEIYKNPSYLELDATYSRSPNYDPIFPYIKNDGKQYFFTEQFKSFFEGSNAPAASLSNYNLCPSVNIWICLGANSIDEQSNYDLYFAADSSAQLQAVADYYSLPYPADNDVSNTLDNNPHSILFWNVDGKPIIPAGIKFIDGIPSIFKLYTYPKTNNGIWDVNGIWDIWMYGASYYNKGKCFEKGYVENRLTGGEIVPDVNIKSSGNFMKAERMRSQRADGFSINYSFIKAYNDPAIFWEAKETSADGTIVRTKHYESSEVVRRIIIERLRGGPTFSDIDKCPDIPFWLGRGWYDDSNEQEMLFPVIYGSQVLDKVAAYYGLEIPYNQEQKTILDNNPALYRARHYDVNKQGPGNFIPVIVASVTFDNNVPIRLLLYTFMRQWEFDSQIVLPEFE
jgi:hypothetical protein